ncbi:hypothetical protein FACS1894124_8470 [Spirochaetia bacterium]|nr:hypothetical protein FACS1894124_8470 [Spirochaetia bacterium]
MNTKPPVDITLEGLGKSAAGLPFVIMELKCGHPITHEILTYTQKAAMIKTIFPYCQYLFVIAADKVALRTWRHGNLFDEIIHMHDPLRDSEITELKTTIQKHLKKAKKTCKRMDTAIMPS